MPSSVAVCRLRRGRPREGRIAEEISLLCSFSVLCVEMRREQSLKCVWDGTTGRENFVSCSHSRLYNRA